LARSLPLAAPQEDPDPTPDPAPWPESENPAPPPEAQALPRSFAEAVQRVREAGEGILANHLMDDVHLVRFEPGRIEMRVTEAAPPNLANRFGAVLEKACGQRWVITVSQQEGEATLRAQVRAVEDEKRAAVLQHPLVQAVLETFPDAKLVARRERAAPEPGHTDDDRGAEDL
jgi:DNA polymerase-3 subunit gamma/tau